MTTIKQADRDAAAAFILSDDCPITAKMTVRQKPLAEAFARHRIQAREQAMNDALTALKSVQYSPAPYTDGMKAIRALCPTPRPDDSEAGGR